MAKTLETKLKIESWDEKPYREFDDGRKFTRAEVALAGTGDGIESATFESLHYNAADGTASYVTLMSVTGHLDGRAGSFVLSGTGAFDGKTATSDLAILPGSGTGDLAGISGTLTSSSTHDDYPHMPVRLHYDLS